MKVIVDTREQQPWTFEGQKGIQTVRKKLDTGDYSVEGLEHEVTIERKSINDWVSTVLQDRTRFYKELERMRSYQFRCVIIESGIEELTHQNYRSNVSWRVIMGFVAEVTVGQSVPVYLAGTRAECQILASGLLWMASKKIVAGAQNVQNELGG